MPDDFGTMNHRGGERGREIEILRKHYYRHREALERMVVDAPTQHLAAEYERILAEIEQSLVKLAELEGTTRPAAQAAAPAAARVPSRRTGREPERAHGDPLRAVAEPGMRDLVSHPGSDEIVDDTLVDYPPAEGESRSRAVLIVVVAVVALGLIGWLIWRASSDRETVPILEDPAATATEVAPVEPVLDALTVTPLEHNYGVIRKGSRATRQFEIANTTDEPLSIQLQRSACRCLYYEYAEVIPPKGKESITVTIDGARAQAGDLRESILVTVKSDPSANTSLGVAATIQ